MSMPPQPPQGPYPPQPPQGPYGPPQPQFQPQHNPYAQQTPYGHPQQQLPPQGPWGQPGVPGLPGAQPPKKKRTGLVIGITVAAIAVVGGLGYAAFRLVDAGNVVAGGFPAAEYRLTVEEKLLDGEFTLVEDMSKTKGKGIEDTYDPSIRNAKAAVAQYSSSEGGVLVLSGMWGQLRNPEFARGKILSGAAEADGATLAVPAKEFTPDGYDITVECQVVRQKTSGVSSSLPMCAWGDGNTGAMVAVVTSEIAVKDPRSIDLKQLAADTAKVRSEVRKPIG
ncbi:hypothetical protein OG609_12870 [Streptomyces sp. NBC_01224]|uniref:hypothetical protein n=1 Tax=Streptomyces sp. NBC_01224 TaxID=2903783 RepID=UPI002E0EF23A|nr:hypothetical protein OG609_12870 [Streptomyces sp. NBC_01224]